MTVFWLDPLSILLLCVNLIELVQICSVLMPWILSVNRFGFFVLCCIVKLTLGPVNFSNISVNNEMVRCNTYFLASMLGAQCLTST
jgi:hypothetical protein